MSLAMDKVLMALSLDEKEVPFAMPDLPEFSSAEENKLSLMGRLLNPDRQKIPNLIRRMPRKWQKEGIVRGIALSPERFQFIFNNEHDLLDVLERGVQTFEEWVIVVERWVENPPEDYLQYVPVWVQIRDIPVNCYTKEALTAMGDLVGKTLLVAFDPSKPITQDFIRVLVKFNVANPLKTSRVITLRDVAATIRFNYEKIQKRCFTCQRLNHEKDYCPLNVRKRQQEAKERREVAVANLEKKKVLISSDDPLFGVLEEEQVGMDPGSGRMKIAEEVLDEMRRYLRADTGESYGVKVDKVQRSVKLAENGNLTHRLALRLEAPPLFTTDLNRGKGIVFDYQDSGGAPDAQSVQSNPNKLMTTSFKAHSSLARRSAPTLLLLQDDTDSVGNSAVPSSNYPTVFTAGKTALCSSGIVKKRPAPRRRPLKSMRHPKTRGDLRGKEMESEEKREGKQAMGCKKRKCSADEEEIKPTSKAACIKAIPDEGLSPPQ